MKKLRGISYSDIENIDKQEDGMYKITLKDGSTNDLALDKGELSSIRMTLRHRSKSGSDDVTKISEGESPSVKKRRFKTDLDSGSIERSISGWRDNIKPLDPDLVLFWPTLGENALYYKNLGAEYAIPDDIDDFETYKNSMNVGESLSPNGYITIHGHVLMIMTKELKKAIETHYYNKREAFKPENRANFISPKDFSQMRSNLGLGSF